MADSLAWTIGTFLGSPIGIIILILMAHWIYKTIRHRKEAPT